MKTAKVNHQIELFNTFKPLDLTFIKTRFTFVDLFAGIGGFRITLEELGGSRSYRWRCTLSILVGGRQIEARLN